MPQDDISALATKVDFLLDEVKNLRTEMADMRSEMASLRSDFDQSKGALRFIKFAAAVTASFVGLWALIHGVRP